MTVPIVQFLYYILYMVMQVSPKLPFIIQIVIGSSQLTVNKTNRQAALSLWYIVLEELTWPLAAMFCAVTVTLTGVVLLWLSPMSGVAAAAGP